MKKSKERIKEWIFLGTICLVILTLMFSGIEGKKRDQERLVDYLEFEKAEKYYKEIKFAKAFPLYQGLVQKTEYQESVSICWGMAQILKDRGEYTEAIGYYDRIKHIYPAIVLNQDFIEEYAEALKSVGDKRAADYPSN